MRGLYLNEVVPGYHPAKVTCKAGIHSCPICSVTNLRVFSKHVEDIPCDGADAMLCGTPWV